jgi:hypothetical protein
MSTQDSRADSGAAGGLPVFAEGELGLSVRGSLHEDVKKYFEGLYFSAPLGKNRDIPFCATSTHDEQHGRIEDRDYAV